MTKQQGWYLIAVGFIIVGQLVPMNEDLLISVMAWILSGAFWIIGMREEE